MIIGITGKYCAGKDTAAEYLVKQGFTHLSLSDVLRREAALRNLSPTREVLISLGNELRTRHGPGVLASLALQLVTSENVVISSIRNPAEVEVLKKRSDFRLIALDAPVNIRWERMKKRAALHNINTFEEFKALESAEQSSDPTKQQLHLVFSLADAVIQNDSTQEELHERINALIVLEKSAP